MLRKILSIFSVLLCLQHSSMAKEVHKPANTYLILTIHSTLEWKMNRIPMNVLIEFLMPTAKGSLPAIGVDTLVDNMSFRIPISRIADLKITVKATINRQVCQMEYPDDTIRKPFDIMSTIPVYSIKRVYIPRGKTKEVVFNFPTECAYDQHLFSRICPVCKKEDAVCDVEYDGDKQALPENMKTIGNCCSKELFKQKPICSPSWYCNRDKLFF